MAFCTRAAVPGSTFSELLMVRETVAVETFALLATSRMFMQIREKNPRRALYSSKRLLTRENMKCNVHAYISAIRCPIALRKLTNGSARTGERLPPRRQPVEDFKQTTNDPWSFWTYAWTPKQPGIYSMQLRVKDRSVPSRRLDAGYYVRSVEITEI